MKVEKQPNKLINILLFDFIIGLNLNHDLSLTLESLESHDNSLVAAFIFNGSVKFLFSFLLKRCHLILCIALCSAYNIFIHAPLLGRVKILIMASLLPITFKSRSFLISISSNLCWIEYLFPHPYSFGVRSSC